MFKKIFLKFFLIFILLNSSLSYCFKMASPSIDLDNTNFSYFLYPVDVLGMKDFPEATEVTPNGSLYTGFAELLFFVGNYPNLVSQRIRTLYKGYLPIIEYEYFYDDAEYKFQMFANLLRENDLKSNLINYVKVNIKNNKNKKLKAYFWVGICFRYSSHLFEPHQIFSPDWKYEIKENSVTRDEKIIYSFSLSENIEKFAKIGKLYTQKFSGREYYILENTPVCLIKYNFVLSPSEEKKLYFKMPYFPIPENSSDLDLFLSLNYEEEFLKTVNFWENLLNRGIKINISEEKVINTFKASLIYDFIARDKIGEDYVQKVNEFQYDKFWLRDSSYIVRCYDVSGYHKEAEESLLYFLKFQKEDGNFISQKGQYDGWGQTLWAFGQHCRITKNLEFAKRVYPSVKKAVEWLKRERKKDVYNIMPASAPMDNELVSGHITGHNFYALLGLRNAIYIAEILNEKKDKEEFENEYKDYYEKFMKKLKEVTKKTGGYIPPALDAEGGEDWGNLEGVYPTEVLSPFDEMVTATLKKAKEKFKEGIMTYGQGASLHHYLTEWITQTELIRGEDEEALKSFYAMLVHTSSTHAGFEWNIIPWGTRDFGKNFSPHGWFAAKYVTLLRNMLLREEKKDLHILSCISPEWIKENEKIEVLNAPTDFGKISYVLDVYKDILKLNISADFKETPRNLIVHIPYFIEVDKVFIDGKLLKNNLKIRKINISPFSKEVVIHYKRNRDMKMSYSEMVENYKKEYIQKYTEYMERLEKERFERWLKK